MKKIFTKLTSLILVIAMLLSMSENAFALSILDGRYTENYVGSTEEIQTAKEIYRKLSPEAREIFDRAIANDPQLLQFHTAYVDSSFNPIAVQNEIMRHPGNASVQGAAYTEPIQNLFYELSRMGLPSAVLYSLQAFASSLAAAIVDGPLPIGDILALISAASVVIIVALNWNEVSAKWSRIVNAFKKAFSQLVNNLSRAFTTTEIDIAAELEVNPCVTFAGDVIIINAVRYVCDTDAADIVSEMKRQNHMYYPALRIKRLQKIFVAPIQIDRTVALAILRMNDSEKGVFALTDSYARGLCNSLGGIDRPAETGSLANGYWMHYHPRFYKAAHCWFIG